MPYIQIRISTKDILFGAWAAAVAEKSTVPRAVLIRSVIRAEITGREFCAAKLHKSRLNNSVTPKMCIVEYSDDLDSDIAQWRSDMKLHGASAPKLIKSYIIRHVEIIDDAEQEYFPDYQDCIEIKNTSSKTRFTSIKDMESIPERGIAKSIESLSVNLEQPVIKNEPVDTNNEIPKKKRGSFVGIGSARR